MEFVASGAQGSIYLAYYQNEPVAVKKVRDMSDLKDANYMKKLEHPNIVRFYGVCSSPGYPGKMINVKADSPMSCYQSGL
jgi:serine/threonine protein kinase